MPFGRRFRLWKQKKPYSFAARKNNPNAAAASDAARGSVRLL
jgi:hypothetical protein